MRQEVLDASIWFRATRGRRREFPGLTRDDVATVLLGLPQVWSPYRLLSHELVDTGRRHESLTRDCRPEELDLANGEGLWQFFIVSESLSDALLEGLPGVSLQTLSTNGAINLQYRRRTRTGEEPSSLGHVPVVANRNTGEVMRFNEYTTIFDDAVKTATRLIRPGRQ